MRYILGCLFSAIIASTLTVLYLSPRGEGSVAAQEREGGPRLKVPGVPKGEQPPAALSPDADQFGPGPGPGFELTPEEQINVAVYEQVNRSVVHITTRGSRTDGFFLVDVPTEGAGSGSVLDKNGHILTNYHVIEEARQVNVTLFDGKSYDAKYVGADPVNDLAVIKIDAPAETLHPVILGDSRRLKVGQRVFAIGNPFGLERTLTTGIISSLNRSLEVKENWAIKSIIQIDAAINPGNSGGPLIDLHGRLIGINTAIASRTGQSAGVGFAIPVNLVTRVVPDLIAHGKVFRPEVGIQRVFETEEGILVERLTPGGPAEQAGLRAPTLVRQRRGPFVFERLDRSTADLIVAVDGNAVKTVSDFREAVDRHKPGDFITLTVIRDKKKVDIRLQLGGGPPAERGTGTRL